MAQTGEMLVASYSADAFDTLQKARRISMEGLQRALSDLSFELSKDAQLATERPKLPPISEVEDAKCECCGMSEECTPEYILRVRDKFAGRWVCGLCSEAVKGEMDKNGGQLQEALDAHMGVCVRFNRIGRVHPVLSQAEAMKQILRKSSRARAKSSIPRESRKHIAKKGVITRSSSCIPAITKEVTEQRLLR